MAGKITVIHDGSHRQIQAIQLAKILEAEYAFERNIIITCGIDVARQAIALKKSAPPQFLVSILDPQKNYEEFDLIFVPEYEPHQKLPNIKTTIGLINQITPELLLDQNSLGPVSQPKLGVLIGGRHIGGNFSERDGERLARILNEVDFYPLISTSKRTEEKAVVALKGNLHKPFFLYDYNKDGQAANPYLRILGAADKIIVTADSVRMCSEAASSGKQVFIFTPEQTHFSYLALRDNFFENGVALDVENLLDNTPTKTLNEAECVAKIIMEYAGQI